MWVGLCDPKTCQIYSMGSLFIISYIKATLGNLGGVALLTQCARTQTLFTLVSFPNVFINNRAHVRCQTIAWNTTTQLNNNVALASYEEGSNQIRGVCVELRRSFHQPFHLHLTSHGCHKSIARGIVLVASHGLHQQAPPYFQNTKRKGREQREEGNKGRGIWAGSTSSPFRPCTWIHAHPMNVLMKHHPSQYHFLKFLLITKLSLKIQTRFTRFMSFKLALFRIRTGIIFFPWKKKTETHVGD